MVTKGEKIYLYKWFTMVNNFPIITFPKWAIHDWVFFGRRKKGPQQNTLAKPNHFLIFQYIWEQNGHQQKKGTPPTN